MKAWLTIASFFLSLIAYAQTDEGILDLADQARKNGRYEQAIQLYREYLDNYEQDPAALFGLAETYRLTFNYSEAEAAYRKVRNTWSTDYPLSVFYYALMLKLNGNPAASVDEFSAFIDTHRGSQRYPDFLDQAYVEKAGSELAMATDRENVVAQHLPEPINTRFNDFSPEIFDHKVLLITSARDKGWSAKKDLRYGEGFMDVHAFKWVNDAWMDEIFPITEIVNSKYHDGNGVFSPDYKKFYFTRCGDGSVQCRIFYIRLNDSGWSKPVPLDISINMPGYDSKQPSFSLSGDTLFFVSDRPGGQGGNDIWMSTSIGADRWRNPENLRLINTAFNELSPRIIDNRLMVFASDGHQGFGGYDLYLYDLSDSAVRVVNAGVPFNSSMDDAYAVSDSDMIYWSSNRKGGFGSFDIYKFKTTDLKALLYSRLARNKSALRADVSKLESEQMEKARESVYSDPFAYEALPARQKQMVDEVILSLRTGRSLPSELEYLASDEREFILKVAQEQIRKNKAEDQ